MDRICWVVSFLNLWRQIKLHEPLGPTCDSLSSYLFICIVGELSAGFVGLVGQRIYICNNSEGLHLQMSLSRSEQ